MLPSDLEVEQAVRDFRAGIDAAGPEPWALKHINYPRGACGHAAELGSLHESALCVRQARTNSERHGSVVRRQADFGMVESCL